MARLLVGTDSPQTSRQLAAYLESVLPAGDELYLVNSRVGGEETSADDVAEGKKALDTLATRLEDTAEVTRNQFVRGNDPVADLLAATAEWNPDELVIGIRKRSPVGKMVFGSTAQELLLKTDRPVRCVPLVTE
jgi:nucleotide-binding universal stress UspA family protein